MRHATAHLFVDPTRRTTAFEQRARADAFVISTPLSRGHARVSTNGRLLHDGVIVPGMARTLAPGEHASGELRVPFRGLVVTVPADLARPVLLTGLTRRGPRHACGISPVLRPASSVGGIARLLADTQRAGRGATAGLVDGLAVALLAAVLEPGPVERPAAALTGEQFDAARAFAEDRLARGLTLEDWARHVGLTAAAFSRRFRRTTGRSPYAWFVQRRVDRACELLALPRVTLCDVADRLGFCSQSHFTAAFRRLTGVSPARWRRRRPHDGP